MANMTDHELDKLLGLASRPDVPEGAAARAVDRAFESHRPDNVVAFRPAMPRRSHPVAGWLAAVPLAASLAVGVYLGVMGSGGYVLPSSLGGGGISEEAAVLSGVEDMEFMTDEDVS